MEFGVMLVDGSIYDQMRIDPTNPKIVLKDISQGPDINIEMKKAIWGY